MKKAVGLIVLTLALTSMAFAGGSSEPDLGTEENPIVWAFVPSGDTQEIAAGGQAVADMIFERTGLVVEASVATEYAGVIEALQSDPPSAHMASLATFSYVVAADRGVAEAELVSVRFGRPFYDAQIIANADSGIQTIDDLAGRSFARPDPLSTSGWIIPSLTMRAVGINPDTDLSQIVDAGGHTSVVTAVYNGDVDAGATWVDARGAIEDDFSDVNERVVVIQVSAPIPNDGVQFHPTIPEEIREPIIEALLDIAATEEGAEALEMAYSWQGLERHGDDFYDPFRQVIQAAGVDAAALMSN
ncbi:MAG: phosphate/phosphite/phosphonate ABC transporter substrate-binding protein [Spirochaetales bacterium]|nr:phosphate/phosphite/phosphonate ABC transporter substrate-binding protein [Spirochaetales bacterium]